MKVLERSVHKKIIDIDGMQFGWTWRKHLSGYPEVNPVARGFNLAKIPLNQDVDDFGRGSTVESESE